MQDVVRYGVRMHGMIYSNIVSPSTGCQIPRETKCDNTLSNDIVDIKHILVDLKHILAVPGKVEDRR